MAYKERNMPVCLDCVHCIKITVKVKTTGGEETKYKCSDTRDIVTGREGSNFCHDERNHEGMYVCGYYGKFFKAKTYELNHSLKTS